MRRCSWVARAGGVVPATDSRTRSCANRNENGVLRVGVEQTEGFQRLEAVEAGLHVEVGDAGEQAEADVAADERGDLQQMFDVVVEVGQRSRTTSRTVAGTPACLRRPSVSGPAVGQESGQLPDEERVAGGAGVDAAGGVGIRIPAGLAADEFGHLGGSSGPSRTRRWPGTRLAAASIRASSVPGAGARSRSAPMTTVPAGSRAARWPNNCSEAASAQCRSSITKTSGRRVARSPTTPTTLLEQAELAAAVRQHRTGEDAVARFDEAAEVAGEPFSCAAAGSGVEDRADRLHPRPHRRRPVALAGSGPRRRARRADPPRRATSSSRRVLPTPGSPSTMPSAVPPANAGSIACRSTCEFLGPADQSARRTGLGRRRRRSVRGLGQHPLVRGLQRLARVDAEFLGEAGADGAEHRQRLRLPSGGAQGGDEARLHGLVQRRHRRGQLQRRQHALRPAQRHREFGCRRAASKNSSFSAAKIAIAAGPCARPSAAGPVQRLERRGVIDRAPLPVGARRARHLRPPRASRKLTRSSVPGPAVNR